jgi:single-strand DNA-binding protein
MNINKVTLAGRLTKDPETKKLNSGTTMATFTLAVNRNYIKDGDKKEETDFHQIKMFGKGAEVLGKYAIKGQVILIDGRIVNRSWEKDGEKHYRTDIVATQFQFGQKPKGAESKTSEEAADEVDTDITPEDIPF